MFSGGYALRAHPRTPVQRVGEAGPLLFFPGVPRCAHTPGTPAQKAGRAGLLLVPPGPAYTWGAAWAVSLEQG